MNEKFDLRLVFTRLYIWLSEFIVMWLETQQSYLKETIKKLRSYEAVLEAEIGE